MIVDGFDFFAVHEAAGEAVARAREGGGPTLIEVKFTRYFGHFEGDQQLYRADEVANARANLDCLKRFRARVTESGQLTDAQLDRWTPRSAQLIDAAVEEPRPPRSRARPTCSPTSTSRTEEGHDMARSITYREAINEALAQEMERDPSRHRHGRGQRRRRRARRARTTPGAASSASPRASTTSSRAGCWTPRSRSRRSSAPPSAPRPAACGPVAELMFIDFMGVCFDQIFNQAAKFRYMFGGKAVTPVVDPHDVGRRAAGGRPAQPVAAPGVHAHPRPQGGRRRRTRTTPRAC